MDCEKTYERKRGTEMYTFNSRIRYSEIDHHGTITLPGIINYFQDCSTFQSEDIGLGAEVLKERKRAWVLAYWHVIVERYPKLGEKITVGTFATGFKGLFGDRNFVMKDENGQQIACANSLWVFMDAEKGRPTRPGAEDIKPYGMEEPLDMPYEGRKIVVPERLEDRESFPVRKYHIDTNEHVNNCQYVQMAVEMLPKGKRVRQLRVDYKKSAVWGDIIYPKVAEEPGRTVVLLCDGAGKEYAVVEVK